MKSEMTHNFHLPLSEELHRKLRHMSRLRSLPATTIARIAIDDWLKRQEKEELSRQIELYARKMAGKAHDLDEELESAAVENLKEMEA